MKNETTFVRAFRGNLTSVCKLKNFKMIADGHRGLPDIYVAGGNWIECKEVVYKGARAFSLMSHISPAQRATLEELMLAGDNTFVAFAITLGEEHYWLLKSWRKFKQMNMYDLGCVQELGHPWNWKAMPELIRYFRPGLPRNYDQDYMKGKFGRWITTCGKDRRFFTGQDVDWRNLPSSPED